MAKSSPIAFVESWIRRIGLTAVFGMLATLMWGLWRGTQRSIDTSTSQGPKLFSSPIFYPFASVGYFGFCYHLWRPLPLAPPGPIRFLALLMGTMLYFPGLALVMWGRMTLSQMYNVSSSFGARLFSNHQLITHGPYAYVRHPMYLGILVAGLGGLLLYRTWTFLFVFLHFPALVLRARREEQVLSASFGPAWAQYANRVPAWIPRPCVDGKSK